MRIALFKKQQELMRRLVDHKGPLLFEKSCVSPSDIGSQFYCEQKVEFAYRFGKVETIDMAQGTEGHEQLVEDFQKVKLEELWQNIGEEGWHWIGEMPLLSPYKDTIIFGKPDQLLFIGGKPQMIFEFKFSKYYSVFPSQEVQAQTYGMELHQIGMDTSNLFYAIVVSPFEMQDQMEKLKPLPKGIFTQFLKDQLFTQDESILSFGEVKVYIYRFNLVTAEKNIDQALEYWKGARKAHTADNKNKCRNCEFYEKCEQSPLRQILLGK